ncbi:MAG: prepilin peptidase [Lachnospiraceae bacterium]
MYLLIRLIQAEFLHIYDVAREGEVYIFLKVFLVCFLVIGAASDKRSRKIPNWLIVLGIVAGIMLRGPDFLLAFGVVTVLFFPLFLCRMIGAGDVKAMAVTAGFLGIRGGGRAIGFTFFLAAGAACFKLLYQKSLIRRLSYFSAYIRQIFQTKTIIAYYRPDRDGYGDTISMGIYLLGGTCLYLWTVR